jgi:polyamine oxidase
VCCAIPLGVLKAKARVLFAPPVPPSKLSAIEACGIGHECKVIVKFPHQFWPDVDFFGTVGRTAGTCTYFQALHRMCGAPVLMFMAAGPEAEEVEAMADDEAVAMVVDALRAIFGKQG